MKPILIWALRLITAAILLQTLYFKFTGAPESVYIFTQMGIEPWGRIGTGVVELVASILLFLPRTIWIGAGLALGAMAGAIASHLFVLGIEVQGDGGQLFYLALVVAACAGILLWIEQEKLIRFVKTRQF